MKGERPTNPGADAGTAQLELFGSPEASPVARPLEERLAELLDRPLVRLVLTRNRTRILSARPAGKAPKDGLIVRLDAAFADAGDDVLAAVAACLVGPARALAEPRRRIRAFFEASRVSPREDDRPPRPVRRRVRGEHFDLEELRDRVNREHFDGRLEVAITWGRRPAGQSRRRRKPARRTIRLGSYDARRNLVRIHPALDAAWVPLAVVEHIVFHEMLHAAVLPQRRGERRSIHTPEFRKRERAHPAYATTQAWLDRHIDRLLKTR